MIFTSRPAEEKIDYSTYTKGTQNKLFFARNKLNPLIRSTKIDLISVGTEVFLPTNVS